MAVTGHGGGDNRLPPPGGDGGSTSSPYYPPALPRRAVQLAGGAYIGTEVFSTHNTFWMTWRGHLAHGVNTAATIASIWGTSGTAERWRLRCSSSAGQLGFYKFDGTTNTLVASSGANTITTG